jgi:transcriptional regulator with GAF, ATPase, and Fis domain
MVLSVVVQLLGAFGAAQFLSWAVREPDGAWKGFLFAFAILSMLFALAVAVVGKIREHRRARKLKNAREQQRLELRDRLMPVASTVADMAMLPQAERLSSLKTVAQTAAGALSALVATEAARARAVVYMLDADRQPVRMVSIGHAGRGERPRPFEAGTARGDGALTFLEGLATAYYPDLSAEKPDGYEGTAQGYNTFISVPIWTEQGVYGMVTLDALKAGTLDTGHVALVELLAEILAIPFEVGQDDDAAESAAK